MTFDSGVETQFLISHRLASDFINDVMGNNLYLELLLIDYCLWIFISITKVHHVCFCR